MGLQMTVWTGYLSSISSFFSVHILHSKAYSITSEATLLEYFKKLRENFSGNLAIPAAGPGLSSGSNYVITKLWVVGNSTSVTATFSMSQLNSAAVAGASVISANTFKTDASESFFYTYDII